MDADCAVVRRGQDQDLERQRQAAFQDVARSAQRPACAESGPPHVLCISRASRTRLPLAAWHCMGVRVGLPASARIGPVAQWLEPTAHNGLVGGSNPPGPTILVAGWFAPNSPGHDGTEGRLHLPSEFSALNTRP